jgi:arabinose-5-phosphate isomerase
MTSDPIIIGYDQLAVQGLDVLRGKTINHLIIVNENKYCGLVHIQDFIKEGLI